MTVSSCIYIVVLLVMGSQTELLALPPDSQKAVCHTCIASVKCFQPCRTSHKHLSRQYIHTTSFRIAASGELSSYVGVALALALALAPPEIESYSSQHNAPIPSDMIHSLVRRFKEVRMRFMMV